MFTVHCPGHGTRVLLGSRSVDALVNTEHGIVVHWHCRCGTRGTLRTGAATSGDPVRRAESSAA